MMQLEDLRRLKMAIDTGNINHYHGDMSQAFVEVTAELLEIKQRAAEVDACLEELRSTVSHYEVAIETVNEKIEGKLANIFERG